MTLQRYDKKAYTTIVLIQ